MIKMLKANWQDRGVRYLFRERMAILNPYGNR
jgi:hypothetical protein